LDIERFRDVIKERERILKETDDEWDYGIEKCWHQETEILAEDIPGTIDFFINECTAEEFSWISEIIDFLLEKTQSKELLKYYKSLVIKFPDESKKYNIKEIVEDVERGVFGEADDE